MTDEELNSIVSAVIAELEKSGVDFDYKADQAQDDDLVFVIRGTAPDYQGVSVTWKSLLDIITAKAEQAKTDAVSAKNIAEAILSQVTTKEESVSKMKASVETAKSEVETMHDTVVSANNSAVSAANAASTSERNALIYMEASQTAKTAAETAKGKAEEAKGLAEEAKQSAESAMGSAIEAKEYAEQLNADTTKKVETFEKSFAGTISDIKAKIQNETTERKNADSSLKDEIAAERSRIDSFTSLENGSTTGDAELIDARVGYDGTTYKTVGTAIRSQISEEKNKRVKETDEIKNRLLPIDFRVTDPNKVILDVNVTGTMEAFVDGMEQEHNDAIALTLEPVVPTADSHNFGVRGQICIDGNYLYVCIADNEWKKIPLQEL